MGTMPSFVILGASGFLGRAVLAKGHFDFPVKAVSRALQCDLADSSEKIIWYTADLLVPGSLDHILEAGDIVIHLAYMKSGSKADNLLIMDNVIDACHRNHVARLVHCSTAIVVGRVTDLHVSEATCCVPFTPYERIKFAMEQRVQQAVVAFGLDAVILRPTAIVGAGGENLVKLAESLRYGSRIQAYLRACFFNRRQMHVVPAQTVVAAIMHLSVQQIAPNGSVYIVSSDDEKKNNFLSIETMLLKSLGLKPRAVPLLIVPLSILSLVLKCLGRSESNPRRIYDSKKILETGFIPKASVYDAVNELGKWLAEDKKGNKEVTR